MRKRLLLTIALFVICLCGCSTISRDEYEAKVNELETVQEELETVQTELENLQKSDANYKRQIVESEMSKAGAKAWTETAFGEDACAIINENDLYVSIPVGYTLSEKSIESLLDKIVSGISLYAAYYQAEPERLPYDSVTIIVLEENTKLDMLSIQFLKDSNGSFSQNTTMINLDDSLELISYINKAF